MTNRGPFPRVGLLYREARAAMPLLELAHAAEERGFDCVDRRRAHPHPRLPRDARGPPAAICPTEYCEFPDPYVALAFVAAQTSLRIATGVALVAQHDPIALAKTIATLDHLSGGRFTLGRGVRLEPRGTRQPRQGLRAIAAPSCVSTSSSCGRCGPRPRPSTTASTRTSSGAGPGPSRCSRRSRCSSARKPASAPSMPSSSGPTAGSRAGARGTWLAAKLGELRQRWVDAGRPESGPIVWPMQEVVDDDRLAIQLDRFQELAVDQVVLDIPTAPERRDPAAPRSLREGDRVTTVIAALMQSVRTGQIACQIAR